MGRPRLGAAAKTLVASTKITGQEQAALVARFGTVHRGLRAALDAYLSGSPRLGGAPLVLAGGSASRTIVASTKISANEAALLRATKGSVHAALRTALDALVSPSSRKPSETVVFTQPTITGTGCRVHKGYHEISRYYEQGIEYVEKECADCGARTTSRVRS